MVTSVNTHRETRGRPRLRDDDDILQAALRAFAEHGYEKMSLRALNAEMGLSRGTINQRFSSKEQLWYAAVDQGFRRLIADINGELEQLAPHDNMSLLRNTFRAFLVASWRQPEMMRLMNQEGLHSTARLDHIVSEFVLPTLSTSMAAMDRLADAGRMRRVPARVLLFLLAHGAAAPFTLRALSERFDCVDGPLNPERHIELATDVIMTALLEPGAAPPK
jgi:AcrR family transcriptional regulator